MPTENRSSNTEMVSELLPCPFCGEKPQITKHHREDIYSFMHRCPVLGPISWGFREDQHAHIEKWNARAAPAPQPHPEPIAWMVGTAFWWTKEEAERDAAETGLPIVGLGPMTCSTEVEQLRELIKHSDAQIMRQSMRISNQRAQLAEAQALLREADEFMYIMTAHDGHAKLAHRYGKDWWDAIDKLRGKVCTALSASAKSSALPDPLGCNACAHTDCGRFDGPRQVECRAMADNACARPGASS
ncbi:Lar family restriction alleviation protein [Pseudomonas sp. NPDC089758]|uniref:Lar family restriction alleviation protein n=1 Tax=Pseudomonas sp. NPDC089758 TaxID=3364473 RepID=UPI003800FB9D